MLSGSPAARQTNWEGKRSPIHKDRITNVAGKLLAGGYRLIEHLHDYVFCPYGVIVDRRRPSLGVLFYNRYPGAGDDKPTGGFSYEHMFNVRRVYSDDPPMPGLS